MLGLPARITACLFDLDGVLTQTAQVHRVAWAQTFDSYLRDQAAAGGGEFLAFDPASDYNRYVDGRPRADGVRTFLASRGIVLPEGEPDDPPTAETVNGLGNRKNVVLLQRLRTDGVEVFPGSVDYLRAVARAGLPPGCRLGQRQRRGGARRGRSDRPARRPRRRGRRPGRGAARQAVPGHLPGRGGPARRPARAGRRLRGRHRRRRSRPGRRIRLRRRSRPGGPGPELLAAGADIVVADLAELMEQETAA